MTDLCTLDQIDPGDRDAVGGKGLSLGQMAQAGLPVPPGFCLTTRAFHLCQEQSLDQQPELTARVEAAYRALGEGPVAVRSSATAEDGEVASFAGQQETFLGVVGLAAVCEAINRCWASLETERAVAYRHCQGVSADGLAMAVVVQKLVPAEVAGVLFTRDPLDPEGRRMLVEAAWGLGESVVSGKVTPDRYHLDRATGAVLERHVAVKSLRVTPTGTEAVPAGEQGRPCLDDAALAELAELGRRVEALLGGPRDVEWARAEGRFWLLQARPITAVSAWERARVRREEIAALAARAEPGGTVWSRFNLAEVLPEPTPMTWAIVRRLMAGRGGFGLMYRDLGWDPDPALDEEGVYDLVCGRPYCNLSREARLHYRHWPYEHPFAALKADPRKALFPQPVLNPSRAGWRFWLTLPVLLARMVGAEARRRKQLTMFAERFRLEIVPAFLREVEAEAGQDLGLLDPSALRQRLEHWVRRTLVDFARDSLKPTALAAVALANLERSLAPGLGPEEARTAVRELIMGVRPEEEADLPGGLRDLAAGRLDRATFLQRFGHRGSQEMELSQPRWSEDPESLARLSTPPRTMTIPSEKQMARAEADIERAITHVNAKWGKRGKETDPVFLLRTYLRQREEAKHYLMKGYFLIRRILVELDRRFHLNGGIFFLTPDELPLLEAGQDLGPRIAERRRRRSILLGFEVPQVLFSDDLDAIDRPVPVEGGDVWQGVPLSVGVAEAEALVLEQPPAGEWPAGPYILVCPSTDPAWVPLFVRAKGLVMETGGVLSHGAIVAREFGLPAVAGLPGVQRRLRTGQRLRVDGGRGTVAVLPIGAIPSD